MEDVEKAGGEKRKKIWICQRLLAFLGIGKVFATASLNSLKQNKSKSELVEKKDGVRKGENKVKQGRFTNESV